MNTQLLKNDATREMASLIDDFLLDEVVDVPVLPTVASKVMMLSQDPDADARDLSNLIQGDPAMAVHIMKVANSPAYCPNGSLISLQQAIARLGMGLIGEIAVSISISAKMFSAPGFEKQIAGFWEHALASALWAKEIARTCRRNVEAIFLCGLLHAIGRPAALQRIIELNSVSDPQLNLDQCLGLVEHFHIRFGAQIVGQWNMPQMVQQVQNHFADYTQATDAVDATAIVVCGAAFADHMLNPTATSEDRIRNLETIEFINLYPDQIDELLERHEDIRTSMETMSA